MVNANVPAGAGSRYFGKDLEAMSFAQNYHRWILSEFAPYLGQIVAEVGAGIGSFSRLLLDSGIARLVAFEPSTNMFPLLVQTLGADERAIAVNACFTPAGNELRFDSILYVNVLEHVQDHATELTNAHAALKAGGHLLLFVPALPWLYGSLDRQVGHYRRYKKGELVELVRHAGFDIVKAHYFDAAGIIPWYVAFVLLERPISAGSVSLYDRLVVPIARTVERLLRPPIGKNLLLVARKS